MEGTIRIGNRNARKANRKVCSYILQDDNLFPWFTVLESMTLAARLKIGNKSHTYRQFMVSLAKRPGEEEKRSKPNTLFGY